MSTPRRLERRRRPSTPSLTCNPLPHSIDPLDLPLSSPTHTLASLRILVLSYLADLESRLAVHLEAHTPLSASITSGDIALKVDEARACANTALEMLASIRADVRSQLPDLAELPGEVEGFVRAHLPDVPSFEDALSHLPDLRGHLDDVRARFSDIDFHTPLQYLPRLSERLQSLHAHLSSMDVYISIPSLPQKSLLSEMLDSLLSSDLLTELLDETSTAVSEGEDLFERAAKEVSRAVKHSFQGSRLIKYVDLPHQWRNNPFVMRGYRFIPIERWHLIVFSVFAFHNEFLNIHTHLIPFLLWTLHSIPFLNPSSFHDAAEAVYIASALLTLFLSAVWHTMSGCAHPHGMEFCARVDYAGIGWLISASVGTVIHYGFQCHPEIGNVFLVGCLIAGVASSTLPFMQWFNQVEYRAWRMAFFVGMIITVLIGPLSTLAYLHSTRAMLAFISPVVPSIMSYLLGLIFYASHVPERFITSEWLDRVGAGSHAIWHAFIVLAISQHRAAMEVLREGLACPA